MAFETIELSSERAKTGRAWGEFQLSILDDLSKSVPPEQISSRVRKEIKEFYNDKDTRDRQIAISVNDSCNLKCGHCYYASTHIDVPQNTANDLTLEEWKSVLDRGIDAGFTYYSLLGKEPLLTPDITLGIIKHLEEQKKQVPEIKWEMVTNGTLIPPNERKIREIKNSVGFSPEFISISFDGYREDHDAVRGKGTYEQAKKGLRILKDLDAVRRTVTHTVMEDNVELSDLMVRDLAENGAQYFSMGFYFPTSFNKKLLNSDKKIGAFERLIAKLENAPRDLEGTISVNIVADEQPNLIAELYRQGYFNGTVYVGEELGPALVIPVRNNPKTMIQVNVLPMMLYQGFRIDHTGNVMDYCADLRSPERTGGFGNIKRQSVPELVNISREKIWHAYTEQFFKRLSDGFKGVNVPAVEGWYPQNGSNK